MCSLHALIHALKYAYRSVYLLLTLRMYSVILVSSNRMILSPNYVHFRRLVQSS